MSLPRWRSAGRIVAVLASAFAAVTCDLVTAPEPGASTIAVNYLGDTVLVVGDVVPLDASVTQGTVPIEGARLRLTSSDTNIVSVHDAPVGVDSIIVKRRGTARIRATLQGSSLGDDPPFVEVEIRGVAAAITIDDSTQVRFQNISDTVTLTATVYRENGTRIDSVTADDWTSTHPGIVAVNRQGKITAQANTIAPTRVFVRALIDNVLDSIEVIVAQQLHSYAFNPGTLIMTALNAVDTVTLQPKDSRGNDIPLGAPNQPTPAFTSLNTGVVTVSGLSSRSFRVASLANDTTRVRVVAGSLDTTYVVSVGQVARSIVIQGSGTPTIDALQDTLRVRARAFDQQNVEVQGRAPIWTSLNTAILTVDANGLITALSLGTALVTARMDASLDTVTVTVLNLPSTIRTSQAVLLPTVKDSVILADTVLNKLGARLTGVPVSWRSIDPSIASVHATSGLVVAEAIGTTQIIGQLANGAADTTLVAVQNRVASVAMLHPDTILASIGDTATMRAEVRNARGALLPPSFGTWSLTDSTVASVASGFVTALRNGFTHVIVSDPANPNRVDSVLVTVTNAPSQVTLNRISDTLTAPSRTLQYVADVRNARGAVILNPNVSYRATNASVASISPGGLATALAVGVTAIIAEAGTGAGLRADTAILRVTNDAVALTVSPTDFTIASVGATVPLAADARNAVGGSVTGVTFTWSSSDNNVATVSATGVVTGVAVGNAVITAQLAGLSATADITVTNAPDTINIAPTSFTMASVNDSIAPPTQLVNALGAALPRASAQWLSDDGGIAAVTSNGVVIAVSRGVTKIRARNALNPSRQDSVTVTVTNAADSINVEQTLDSLPSLNRTLQYTAAVFNARRDLIPGEPVTWTSRNGSIATVSATTGLATSVGIGSTYIVGTAGTVRDSALLVVSNFAATLQLTPATISLAAVGATQLLTAVARNELGNIIVNPAATWSSSNPAVASVSTAGPAAAITVTAQSVGTATISATVDGIVQSVDVSVANAPTTLQITSGNLTLASIGDQATPSVNFRNAINTVLPRDAAIWTTSNANIVTVSSTGTVTAIAAGVATITATSPANATLFSSITVTVTNAPATVTVAPAGTTTLTALGGQTTLTATVRNAAGAIINNPSVTWSTVGGAVSVGASTGVVTANANTAGQIVTATSGTATGNATIAVAQSASPATSTISRSAASITANGAATATITVQLKDANGNNLTGSGGAVAMTLTGTGSLSGVTNNNNGTYTATLTAPTALGSGSVSASINSAAITTGDPMVTYVAGAASRYIVTTSTATPEAGAPVTITAQQADQFNNPVTTPATVTWSSTGGGTFGAGSSPTNGSGIATVTFNTSGVSGTAHTVAGATGLVSGSSPVITTIPGAAAKYLVSVSSPNPAASSAVTVTAQLADANNNPVLVGGRTVNWSKTGAGGTFGSAQSVTTAAGIATVSFTVGTTATTVHTAIATDNANGSINGTSSAFTVAAGALNNFLVTAVGGGAIGTQTAGTPFNVQITARDIDGNTTGYTGTVLISSSGTLSGGTFTSGSFVGGVLASQAVTLTNTGSFTIAATKAVTGESGTSAAFTTNAGALDHFLVEAQGGGSIGTQAATTPFNIRITAQDQFNNTRTQFTGVSAVLTSNGTLSGAPLTTGNFTNGVLASQAVTMTAAGSNITLTATALGEDGTSNAFTVGGGTATKYLVTSSDNAPQAGSSVLITAQLADAGNNAVFQSGQSVNWSKTGTGGSFATPFSVTNAQGVATVLFTTNTSSNTTHTVTATDNTALTGTSANIVTGAGAPTNLIFSVQPTSPEIVNQTMSTVTVTARDNNNNTSTGFNGNVTLSIASGTGTAGAVLNGTVTVAAVNGVATFNNVSIDRAGTNYRLTATMAGPITVNSNQFNVNNPAPTLTTLNPTSGNRLQTLDVVFTGTGFLSGVTTVTVGANITVNNVTVNSSTQLTANITIASGAATGARNFTVTNPAPGGGTSLAQSFTVNNPAPTLASIAPATGNRLQTLDVVFTGTGFITGVSSVTVGAGITVNTTTVNSSTQITANLTISSGAATGPRNFSVTNAGPGGGTSLDQVFTVNNPAPTLATATPNTAVQGQTGLDVALTGTGFITGVSSVSFSNAGITVNNTTVNSATSITANITVAAGATTGAGTVSVTNSGPGGGTSGTQAFTINAPAAPTLTNLAPNTGNRLQTLDVVFTGTGFASGVTSVNVPAGFTVNTTTVTSGTSLTANITIGATAPTGANGFSVTNTPAGGTSGTQNFTVSNPSPTLTGALSPNVGELGQTLDVTFTGTNFIQGVTAPNVGANITVNTVTVNSATELVANLTIGATAITGARNFSVTNAGPGGGTSGNQSFTINNPVPTVATATPNTGVQGQTNLNVVLGGTNFVTGVSTVTFEAAGITVNNTTVNSPTQITVNISIGSGTTTGPGDISVTNGAPGGGSGTLTDGFTVNAPVTPTLTTLNPAAANRLQTLDVVFTGADFVSGVSSVQVGAGITLNTTTVNSPTQITANITVTAAAATGTRQFTVTNNPGGLVSGTQDFEINNPAPTATVASPNTGVQGQTNLNVAITGTNFMTGVTTVTFENVDITVNTVTVNSPTQVTANISIAPTASTGAGDITVTNGAPVGGSATITDGFTVNAPPAPTLTAALAPNTGNRLQTLDVVFTGTDFINGVTSVSVPAGFTVNNTTISSSTSLTANITVTATAPTGANNFFVTNTPPGGNSGNRTFTVSNPAPTLTNVTPTTVDPGTTFDLTLTGTGFIQGVSSVVISGNQVNNIVVTVNSPTQITATVTLGGGASAGTRTVRVDNAGPGGGSSANVNITVN